MDRPFFIHSTGFVDIGAVTDIATPTDLLIDSEADFICDHITLQTRQANLLVANWSGLVQIEVTSSGRKWFNVAIPGDAIAGNGENPYKLPAPIRIPKKSNITITFTHSGAIQTHVCLNLHGYKELG